MKSLLTKVIALTLCFALLAPQTVQAGDIPVDYQKYKQSIGAVKKIAKKAGDMLKNEKQPQPSAQWYSLGSDDYPEGPDGPSDPINTKEALKTAWIITGVTVLSIGWSFVSLVYFEESAKGCLIFFLDFTAAWGAVLGSIATIFAWITVLVSLTSFTSVTPIMDLSFEFGNYYLKEQAKKQNRLLSSLSNKEKIAINKGFRLLPVEEQLDLKRNSSQAAKMREIVEKNPEILFNLDERAYGILSDYAPDLIERVNNQLKVMQYLDKYGNLKEVKQAFVNYSEKLKQYSPESAQKLEQAAKAAKDKIALQRALKGTLKGANAGKLEKNAETMKEFFQAVKDEKALLEEGLKGLAAAALPYYDDDLKAVIKEIERIPAVKRDMLTATLNESVQDWQNGKQSLNLAAYPAI